MLFHTAHGEIVNMAKTYVLIACFLFINLSLTESKYKQVEIEILGKNEEENAKIFSNSELEEFDGSNVS